MAQAVVDLIISTGCSHCLVWSKNDELVRRVKLLQPGQPCGFIVAAGLSLGTGSAGHVLPQDLRPDCRVCSLKLLGNRHALFFVLSGPAFLKAIVASAHAYDAQDLDLSAMLPGQ